MSSGWPAGRPAAEAHRVTSRRRPRVSRLGIGGRRGGAAGFVGLGASAGGDEPTHPAAQQHGEVRVAGDASGGSGAGRQIMKQEACGGSDHDGRGLFENAHGTSLPERISRGWGGMAPLRSTRWMPEIRTGFSIPARSPAAHVGETPGRRQKKTAGRSRDRLLKHGAEGGT